MKILADLPYPVKEYSRLKITKITLDHFYIFRYVYEFHAKTLIYCL